MNLKNIVETCGTPTFVYSEEHLISNIRRIKDAVSNAGLNSRVKLQAAYFTNANPYLYKLLRKEGVRLVVQSVEEVLQLAKFGMSTGINAVISSANNDELDFYEQRNIPINVFIPEELEYCLEADGDVGIRLDLSVTQDQRIGLKLSEFEEVNAHFERLEKFPTRIHTYPGTGSEYDKLIDHARMTLGMYNNHFPYVGEINLGGGFAFDYEADTTEEKHFPWSKYFRELNELLKEFGIPEEVVISIEPGRDIFADVGKLVTMVNRVHRRKNQLVQGIFTDASFVYMPSATMRARQHQVRFLDDNFKEIDDRNGHCTLSGCTTLSSDYVFPGVIKSPVNFKRGGYVVIEDIGAYGASQHLEFLNKRPAPEVLVRKDGTTELITQRGKYTDRVRYVLDNPKRLEHA